MFLRTLLLSSLLAAGAHSDPHAGAAARPNVLILLADDLGVDLVGAYGEGPAPPCTPTIDALAESGILFRNAWSNPRCSPTRAQLLTGRHAFRTGVGSVVHYLGTQSPMPDDEVTLAEALPRDYTSALLGKWHLAYPELEGLLQPNVNGFDHYAGVHFNVNNPPLGAGAELCTFGVLGYSRWVKVTNGVESCEHDYVTRVTVDDAIETMRTLPEPWFVLVSFQSVHGPQHEAPADVCPQEPCYCGSFAPTGPAQTKTMTEAFDAELARVLPHVPPSTYVFFLGDNGTAPSAAEGPPGGCFDPLRSKGTLYQGGIRVPFIASGPGVPQGVELEAAISVTDLFATVMALAGTDSNAEDSVSLGPYLRGSSTPVRETVYSEIFSPNGDAALADWHNQAVRDERWKLIRRRAGLGITEELYDLANDPCEETDLCDAGDCSGLSGELARAHARLVAALPW